MKIGELQTGTRVFLEATKEGTTQEWQTTVCGITAEEDLIAIHKLASRFPTYEFNFLDPIIENGMLVDFGSKEVKKNLVHTKGQDPYAWKNVAVFNVSLPKYGRTHAVAATGEDLPHNRRGSFRVHIAKPGQIYLPGDIYGRKVIVNDLSATGIGLIVDNVEGIQKDDKLNVKFVDENRFSLNAYVRRIHEMGPQRIVVGCEFDKFSDSVAQFVNMKQVQFRRAMQERENRRR